MKLAFFLFLSPLLTSVSAQAVFARKQSYRTSSNNKTNSRVVAAAASGDPQKSLCLDPKVVSTGFQQDGLAGGEPGQVASLTSSNNFINFCLTVPGTPLTNGKQVQTGSCNTAPMGVIPSTKNVPSAKFVNPPNGGTVKAKQDFQVQMAINNLETGNFVNAAANYYAAPQHLNKQGLIIGHSHIVIQALQSLSQTTPLDPTVFAFFKGLNDPAKNGVLSAAVAGGLPAGAYRMCSINTSANHVPVLGPVAQHGMFDDCSYFTADDNGGAAANKNKTGGDSGKNKTTTTDKGKTSKGGDKTASKKNKGTNPVVGGGKKKKGANNAVSHVAVNKTAADCGDDTSDSSNTDRSGGKTRKNGKRRLI